MITKNLNLCPVLNKDTSLERQLAKELLVSLENASTKLQDNSLPSK
jgi:hypothetical protein